MHKRGMYRPEMARPKTPPAAARHLVAELAQRNVTAGYRAIEDWAARGLAPAPVRRSRGRGRGTVSEYPPGAADQYAAVAAVMRRGRPWQVSVLKLLVRGHLPTNENLIRRAFREILATPAAQGPWADALDYAEEAAAQAAATRFARPILHAFERNLRHCPGILEPGTSVPAAALGVVATLALALAGQPQWTPEALLELLAAYGIPVADMDNDARDSVTRFAEDFFTLINPGPALSQLATEIPMGELLAAIPRARDAGPQMFTGISEDLPPPNEDIADVLTAMHALLLARIDRLGGDEAIAELARHAIQPGTSLN
jgi:hypothetical protein